jgi:hypothetical protein
LRYLIVKFCHSASTIFPNPFKFIFGKPRSIVGAGFACPAMIWRKHWAGRPCPYIRIICNIPKTVYAVLATHRHKYAPYLRNRNRANGLNAYDVNLGYISYYIRRNLGQKISEIVNFANNCLHFCAFFS